MMNQTYLSIRDMVNNKYLLFYILLIYYNVSFAQKKIITSIQKSSLTINNKITKIDSFLSNNNIANDSLFIIKSNYAKWLYKNNKAKKAIQISNEVLYLIKNTSDSINIQKTLFWLGYYNKKYNIAKSSFYYTKCLLINRNNKLALNSYYFLGNNNQKNNNYLKAIENYQIAIKLSQKLDLKQILRNSYYQIANCYYVDKTSKNLQKAIFYAKKSDSLSNVIPTTLNTLYLNKIALATMYSEEENLNINKSQEYYNQALVLANNPIRVNEIYLELGGLYNTSNFNKSITYLNKIHSKKNDSILISKKAFNYALTYYYNKNYKMSIEQYKKSINYLINNNFSDNQKINRNLLISYNNKSRLLHILPFFAKTYYEYFKEIKDTILLKKSIFYYKLSDQLVDLIKENSTSFKSRMFWREKSEKVYSRAIESCYESKNIEDALFFMEKNKALLLSEDITTQNYKLTLNINIDLLEKEKDYKKQLNQIELNIDKHKDSLLQVKLDLERQLLLFQDSIYKGKFKKNNNIKIITKKEIQKNLNQNEVFIEYHISSNNDFGIFSHDKNGYLIVLTKDEKIFVKIEKLNDLKDNIINYLKILTKPLKTNKEFSDFSKKSFQIYNALFPTEKIKSIIKNKNLIIVPNRILSFLPFETLITKNNSLEYLIYNSEISYTYSMTFQKDNKLIKRTATNNFLGIAPLNFNYDSLANLPETKFEVNNISKILNSSNTLIDNNATKSAFLNLSNKYNIIHFATHADANNGESPWIALKDKKIFLNELYTTKTQADLIVLSACNTSLGKVETGEGIMSLARGFFYSGANSVISSLWNVNDKSTTDIMTNFYKNLKNGQTKSKALQQARINYLNTHSLSEASPYYWASFILIGDAGKLHQIPNKHYWYYYLIGFLVAFTIIMAIAFIKRLQRRTTLSNVNAKSLRAVAK